MSVGAPVQVKRVEDLEEDIVEKQLKESGCLKEHFALKDCVADTQDWRKCQRLVSEFKECMKEHNRRVRSNPAYY